MRTRLQYRRSWQASFCFCGSVCKTFSLKKGARRPRNTWHMLFPHNAPRNCLAGPEFMPMWLASRLASPAPLRPALELRAAPCAPPESSQVRRRFCVAAAAAAPAAAAAAAYVILLLLLFFLCLLPMLQTLHPAPQPSAPTARSPWPAPLVLPSAPSAPPVIASPT